MAKDKKPLSPKIKKYLIVGGIVYLAVTVFVVLPIIIIRHHLYPQDVDEVQSAESEPDETWRDKGNIDLARNMTKELVKKNLKSPSTAKFPGLFTLKDHIIYLGDQRYKTVSWVDAKNSFGTTVRMNYTAVVEQTGDATWRLESLDFDN